MNVRSAILSLALAATTTFAVAADTNSFTIVKAGKTIGKASYSIDFSKDIYKVKSHYQYRFTAAPIDTALNNTIEPLNSMLTEAQISEEYKVDANGIYLSGYLQDAATQMITSFQPSKARDAIVISSMQGGIAGDGRTLPMPKPDFLVAPNYDPSAIQIFITTALAHPHPDNKYSILTTITAPRPNNTLVYAALQIAPDDTGTLDGKPITLKHYTINYAKGHSDLFLDDKGTLMQADMGPLGVSYIRARFVLSAK